MHLHKEKLSSSKRRRENSMRETDSLLHCIYDSLVDIWRLYHIANPLSEPRPPRKPDVSSLRPKINHFVNSTRVSFDTSRSNTQRVAKMLGLRPLIRRPRGIEIECLSNQYSHVPQHVLMRQCKSTHRRLCSHMLPHASPSMLCTSF